MHTLYDVETQIPAFFHTTEASVHDSKVMIEVPYEPDSYYIFDRGYNNFKMLYKIHQIEEYEVLQPSFLLSGLLSAYTRYGIQGAIPLFQQYYLNIVYSIMKNVAWQWLDS